MVSVYHCRNITRVRAHPDSAIAIISFSAGEGSSLARVPADRSFNADEYCRYFAGVGRMLAAGIDTIRDADVDDIGALRRTLSGSGIMALWNRHGMHSHVASADALRPTKSCPTKNGIDFVGPLAGGGGALRTPLIVFLVGTALHTAVRTDLLSASITKAVGGWVLDSRASIDWLVLRRLAASGLTAAALTIVLLHDSPQHAGLHTLILPALGAALARTSVAMIFQPQLHRLRRPLRTQEPGQFKHLQALFDRYRGRPARLSGHLTSVGAVRSAWSCSTVPPHAAKARGH